MRVGFAAEAVDRAYQAHVSAPRPDSGRVGAPAGEDRGTGSRSWRTQQLPPQLHGPPDWQPHPQPEPQPQAPSTGRDGLFSDRSGVVGGFGASAMASS